MKDILNIAARVQTSPTSNKNKDVADLDNWLKEHYPSLECEYTMIVIKL